MTSRDAALQRRLWQHRVVISVGLVLSAGGSYGDPWHVGAVAALGDETGWDARRADLIVGTSVGSITGLGYRVGVAPADRLAQLLGRPVSPEGRAVLDRVVTPYREGAADRRLRPQSPRLALAALWPPWRARPVHAGVGLVPAGRATTEALERRLAELHPERWPAERFWVTAVRLADGRRVVFGRDDAAVTAARAVRASCAVPGRYRPVMVGGHRCVDGGVESSTNADLAGPPAFDLVVVSSAMTGPRRGPGGGGRDRRQDGPGRGFRVLRRDLMRRRLSREVAAVRRRGSAVLVLEPDAETVEAIDAGPGEGFEGRIARAAYEAARRRLRHQDGPGFASLLEQAAAQKQREPEAA